MKRDFNIALFERDIAQHKMEVIRDDGVSRHLRFRQPRSCCMYFDLITWRGHLCYTGDMGTYVFSRLSDMFKFFRGNSINPGYWAEKVLASDKSDGIEKFSAEIFRATIKKDFDERTEDWDPAPKDKLWEEIEDQIFGELENGEPFARAALDSFDFNGFRFYDSWEWSFSEWSFHYVWCCQALIWGIALYDTKKQQESVQ